MVGLVAVNVPVLQDDYLFGVVGVEEDAVAPGRRALGVVVFLELYGLVGGQEVDGRLGVHAKRADHVVEEEFVLLQQTLEVGLHIGLGQLLLCVLLLNGVQYLPHTLVLGLKPEVQIAHQEAVLALVEESAFGAFV